VYAVHASGYASHQAAARTGMCVDGGNSSQSATITTGITRCSTVSTHGIVASTAAGSPDSRSAYTTPVIVR